MKLHMGRLITGGLAATALIAGVGMYYLQVYAFYDDVPAGAAEVRLTRADTGRADAVDFTDFAGIDSDSSPIRYRACFTLTGDVTALADTYETLDDAAPRVAPGWFDCFDADAIGAALESGDATAYVGIRDVNYGIDRIVTVFPDGRAYAWHDINRCGEVLFDGDPLPDDCPPPPESAN